MIHSGVGSLIHVVDQAFDKAHRSIRHSMMKDSTRLYHSNKVGSWMDTTGHRKDSDSRNHTD